MAASHHQIGHLLMPKAVHVNGGGGFPTNCFINISNCPPKFNGFHSSTSARPLNFRPNGSPGAIRYPLTVLHLLGLCMCLYVGARLELRLICNEEEDLELRLICNEICDVKVEKIG